MLITAIVDSLLFDFIFIDVSGDFLVEDDVCVAHCLIFIKLIMK